MEDKSILKAQLKEQLDHLVQTRFEQEVIISLTNLVERDPFAITWVMQLERF